MIFRKKNLLDNKFNYDHIGDVIRLERVAEENGYEADLETCAYLWDEYSDRLCAGWLGLPEDDNDLWTEVERQARYLNHIKGFEV